MVCFVRIWTLLVTFLCSAITAQQDCILASNGDRPLPTFVRPGGGKQPRFTMNPIQAIVTSYMFTCCGVVTEWRSFVEGSGSGHFDSQPYNISFQVWRPNSPSPVDTDGCYSMTGVNHFSPIPLADPTSDNRGMVTGSPSKSERIAVQPGDVVGFYLESSRNLTDGIQFAGDSDNDPDYTDETVWYATATVSSSSLECPLPIGPTRTLATFTNHAPLISIAVLQSECQLSVQPSASSSVPHSLTPSHQSPTPTSEVTSSPELAPVNAGLYVGIAVLVFVLVVGVAIAIVILFCVIAKKMESRLQRGQQTVGYSARTDELTEKKIVNSTEKNDGVYLEVVQSTEHVYSCIQPSSTPDRMMEMSQNPAYGEIIPRAEEDDEDYYVNEGMGGAAEVRMTGSKANATSRQSVNDTLYSNTDGVEEGESTYECVT